MLTALRLRLVDDWKQAWKWSSTRFIALGTACQGAVVACPEKVAQHVPEWVFSTLSVTALACLLLAMVGRVTTTEPPNVQNPG